MRLADSQLARYWKVGLSARRAGDAIGRYSVRLRHKADAKPAGDQRQKAGFFGAMRCDFSRPAGQGQAGEEAFDRLAQGALVHQDGIGPQLVQMPLVVM